MVLESNEPQPNMGLPGTGGFTLAILDGGDAEAMAPNWREKRCVRCDGDGAISVGRRWVVLGPVVI